MASLVHDCPNCPAERQGFTFLSSHDHPVKGPKGAREFLIFKCGNCHYPVVVEVYRLVSNQAGGQPLQLTANFKNDHYRVLSIRPSRTQTDSAPLHTPDVVANCYAQGCRALQRGDADAAGMVFRKALDTATRQLIRALNPPDLEAILGRKLKPRIDWLHGQGKLTVELRDWAHMMRDEGNDAAHEEDAYKTEEAQDLRDLTEVFLMYVFTIPGKIAERHPNLEAEVAETTEPERAV